MDPIAYSFIDVQAAIEGPGGNFSVSEGGVGTGMHSARASRAGRVTIRLLKNSPINRKLMDMRNAQKAGGLVGGAFTGRNILTLTNPYWGDDYQCRAGAFGKAPNVTYAEDGNTNEWVMNFIYIDSVLGDGSLVQG
jgi:hypothetical protein